MRITNLTEKSKIYTSNVFLVLGDWNTVDDINTLIDVGCDDIIIGEIERINTGLGKKKIDQVIVTHSHSDHAAIMPAIKEAFNPRVCAFNSHLKGIDQILKDGDLIRIGDRHFEVYHITAHSYDSICLFCEENGILFAGDTTFPIVFENEVLRNENEQVLSRLLEKKIRTVYSGHGIHRVYEQKLFKVFN